MVELTALSSRTSTAIATFLNFYVSHGRWYRLSKGGNNIILIF